MEERETYTSKCQEKIKQTRIKDQYYKDHNHKQMTETINTEDTLYHPVQLISHKLITNVAVIFPSVNHSPLILDIYHTRRKSSSVTETFLPHIRVPEKDWPKNKKKRLEQGRETANQKSMMENTKKKR